MFSLGPWEALGTRKGAAAQQDHREATGRVRLGCRFYTCCFYTCNLYNCERSATTILSVLLCHRAAGHQLWIRRGCWLLVTRECSQSAPAPSHRAAVCSPALSVGTLPATCRLLRGVLAAEKPSVLPITRAQSPSARGGCRGVSRAVASLEWQLVPPREALSDPSVQSKSLCLAGLLTSALPINLSAVQRDMEHRQQQVQSP